MNHKVSIFSKSTKIYAFEQKIRSNASIFVDFGTQKYYMLCLFELQHMKKMGRKLKSVNVNLLTLITIFFVCCNLNKKCVKYFCLSEVNKN